MTTTTSSPNSRHALRNAAGADGDRWGGARSAWLLAVLLPGLVAAVWTVLAGVAVYGEGRGWSGMDAPVRYGLVAAVLVSLAVLAVAGLPAAARARNLARHADEMGRVTAALRAELARAESAARPVVVAAARDDVGRAENAEVSVNLALRLQSLVHQGIERLDELENNIEDPDVLKGVFQVDHLTTRIRRYAESLAVLGGAVAERQWTRPVNVIDVMRSAVAEVEQYSRVKVVPPVQGTVRGHAVADVVHLLAELAENATKYSPPQTRVLLRAETVSAGLAVEVEDRGLGVDTDLRNRMNTLLRAPDRVILGDLLRDGRIGLYVVSVLARRHHISVQLQRNIYGGTQAVLVIPHDLLGEPPEAPHWSPAAEEPVAEPLPHRSPTPAIRADGPVADLPMPVAATQQLPTVGYPSRPVEEDSRRAAAVPEGPRPVLPTRRRQQHMAPELREPVRPADTAPDVGHDPDLMASFQAGIRRAGDLGESPDSLPHPQSVQTRSQRP